MGWLLSRGHLITLYPAVLMDMDERAYCSAVMGHLPYINLNCT